MLRNNLTMEVNENLSVCAHHPLVLLGSIQLAAIDTTTEQSATLVLTVSHLIVVDRPTRGAEQGLKLLHEQLTCELIPFVN
jgi:hypothetical protein